MRKIASEWWGEITQYWQQCVLWLALVSSLYSLECPGWGLNDELHLMDTTNNSFLGGPAIIPVPFFLVYCKIPILYRQFFWKHTLQLLSSSVLCIWILFNSCKTAKQAMNCNSSTSKSSFEIWISTKSCCWTFEEEQEMSNKTNCWWLGKWFWFDW